MAEQDSRLVGITPAMCEGSGMVEFSKRFPNRYYDVAIAEQHALTLAATDLDVSVVTRVDGVKVGKAGRIGCRQLLVAAIGGQFHDRLGPQRTIEMLVKEDLGELFVQHPGRLSLEVGGPQALFIGRQ